MPVWRPSVPLRAALLGLALALSLAISACSGGEGEAPATPDPLRPMAEQMTRESERLKSLCSQSWLSNIPFRTRLWGRAGALDAWIRDASEPDPPANILERGQRLLAAREGDFAHTVAALEAVNETANEVHGLAITLRNTFAAIDVPENLPFPLREVSFKKGWMPGQQEAFQLLAKGIDALAAGQDPTHFRIGAAALAQRSQDGAELKDRLGLLIRDLEQIPGRQRRAETWLTWARDLQSRAPEGTPAETLTAIQEAITWFEGAWPPLEARLTATLPGLLVGESAAKERLDAVTSEIQAFHEAFITPLLSTARDLGIPPPGGRRRGS